MKVFKDLNCRDDVSTLEEMVEILLLSLSQATSKHSSDQVLSTAAGNELEVVEAVTYLGSHKIGPIHVAQTNRKSSAESQSPDPAWSFWVKQMALYNIMN